MTRISDCRAASGCSITTITAGVSVRRNMRGLSRIESDDGLGNHIKGAVGDNAVQSLHHPGLWQTNFRQGNRLGSGADRPVIWLKHGRQRNLARLSGIERSGQWDTYFPCPVVARNERPVRGGFLFIDGNNHPPVWKLDTGLKHGSKS